MGTPRENRFQRIIREIHRRSLWQVLAIYVAGSWVVFEAVQTLTEGLGLPGWFPAFAFVLLLIGLPVVLATAFVQEGRPHAGRSGEPLIDASGRAIEDRRASARTPGTARRVLTWRNAFTGGVLALALWGVVAAGWILFGGGSAGVGDSSPSRPSLAVLPFDNLSPDPDNAYFAAGIHEEILTHLSRIEGLRLISRTSVLRYQESEQSLTAIGEELGVANVLEGSVQRVGDQVRITVQLNDARQDEHLWAESYERELSDIFQIQTDVATTVVHELRGVLTPEEQSELARRPTEDLEAYAHYLRGHEHFRGLFSEPQARAAAGAYAQAVALDPSFVAAWVRLVQTRLWLSWRYGRYEERTRARSALERLEALAPGTPHLHFARGLWFYYGELRFEDALRELDVVSDAWPEDVNVMRYRGALFRRLGRWNEAVEAMEQAFELDPADAAWAAELARTYVVMRRFDEAERYGRIALSLEPGASDNWWWLVYARLSRGDTVAARTAIDSARHEFDETEVESIAAWALWQFYADGTAAFVERHRHRPSLHLGDADLGLAAASAQGRMDLIEMYGDTLERRARDVLSSAPEDYLLVRSLALSQQALVEAYLGSAEGAVRLASEAVQLYPVSRDALHGPRRILWQAHVLTVVGRHDEAVERLRYLLTIPADMATVPLLRMDPRWDPLRDDPGFQALLEEHDSG